MSTPPFLLGAAILFWGWRADQPLVAVAIAVAIEGARAVSGRLELTEPQQYRVADLCTILAVAVGATFVATSGFPRSVVLFFEWLPVVLLPLGLMQAWGAQREVSLRVLFWSLRRVPVRDPVAINLGHPYLVLWLLAASAAEDRGPGFDLGFAAMVAWALWPLRPRRRGVVVWTSLVALAGAAGFAGGEGLRGAQLWLENHPELMSGGGTRVNPYRGTTDIGQLGELKQSDAIVLRIRAEAPLKTPLLLHRASYVEYNGRDWIARGGSFERIAAADGERRWRLSARDGAMRLVVTEYAPDGDPVLSLPAAVTEVASPRFQSLKGNPLGAFQAGAEPGYVAYRVHFDRDGPAGGAPPTAADLLVPASERAAVERISRQWGLSAENAAGALALIVDRFRKEYAYSTFQEAAARGRTPLADFLERSRAGHCEHFASATVLLLRAAGIPARYATGFSLQEWSELEKAWIARERHSHAWVRAWVGDRWVDVDPTPPTWLALEVAGRPAWSRLQDAWSWARYRMRTWVAEATPVQKGLAFGVPLVPLLLFIVWRLSRLWRRPAGAAGVRQPAAVVPDYVGSAFLPVARFLASRGAPRLAHETTREWIARLGPRPGGDAAELAVLADLYYRERFDPEGLAADERAAFAARAERWVQRAADAAAAT